MDDAERAELQHLASQVCPHTYRGLPCDREAGHGERHWNAMVNWPSELSDQNIEQAAS